MPDATPPPGRAPAPLLIMGSPRSGTTFLAQMVNRFFDHHIATDNGTLLRYHRSLPHYTPLADDANLLRLIESLYQDHYFQTRLVARGLTLEPQALLARVGDRTYGGLVEAVLSSVAESHGKRHWGYKRASFARVGGQAVGELFPSARFVHIVRDARDVVLSMRNSPNVLTERSWHFGAVDWVDHVTTGRQIGRALGPDRCMEVRYEDLMADPVRFLTNVLYFCGAADVESRAARIATELPALVKVGNSDKWRKAVPPAALRLIERVAGPVLVELGYPIINADVSGKPVGLPEMVWLQADRVCRNLFTRNLSMMVRYRLEGIKGYGRARLAQSPTKKAHTPSD